MTTQSLLERLNGERDRLNSIIEFLVQYEVNHGDHKKKRKAILKAVKKIKKRRKYTRKNPHWTQLPENKERMKTIFRKNLKKRKK